MEPFTEMLALPRGNALGRTEEVVEAVLAAPGRMDELMLCWRDGEPWTRLRAGSAVKRLAEAAPDLVRERLDVVLGELADLEQPSVRWNVARLVGRFEPVLTAPQRRRAVAVLRRSLAESDDWIVLNETIRAAEVLAARDAEPAEWLVAALERLSGDRRRSVARRAQATLGRLTRRAGGGG